jgi:uncharacterized protein
VQWCKPVAKDGELTGKTLYLILRRNILSLVISLIIFVAGQINISIALEVPPLRGRVNDLARMLPADRAQQLEERLAAFEQETGHQIAVLTIPSLEGDSLEDFSIRVAEAWKVGQRRFDNGAILLVAQKERKIRIEVGYGLEGILPDAVASRIIREEIAPRFRTGDYVGALDAGTEAIIKVARGEAMAHSAAAAPRKGARGPIMDPSLFIFAAFIAVIVGITRRTPVGGAVGGAISGGAVGTLASSSGLWIFYLLVGAVTGFLANFYAERAWGKPWSVGSSRRARWPRDTISYSDGGGGDFGGGGFGGDFGSGGFSGGGGDFGGGGASGDG